MAYQGVCAVHGCGKPIIVSRGWCEKHYCRWKRHGDPLLAKKRWRSSSDTLREEKSCLSCKEVKPLVDFAKDGRSGDGVRGRCKVCISATERVNRDPEKERERGKRYRANNPGEARERTRRWRKENYSRYSDNAKAWRLSRPDEMKAIARRSYEKRKLSLQFRLQNAIKAMVHSKLTGRTKRGRRTFSLLGYSVDELRIHLERQFLPGMTWENYGREGWHIDHIVPLASFSYTSPDEAGFKAAWALTNLQPLWATDNLKKGAKLVSLL